MIGITAFTVFALGLRHGADPDHLAAIDNLTRNSVASKPRLSRYIGTLFAVGHSAMVLAIAALAGIFGTRFAMHHEMIEMVGTMISIAVLLIISLMNIMQLRKGNGRLSGAKTQLLPRMLKEAKNPLIAVPIGILFGFGFETSSQIATYALAFGTSGGLMGAIIVGALFSLGMIITDSLDSVLVHRLTRIRGAGTTDTRRIVRTWILTVTALALFAAGYEALGLFGIVFPVSDLSISAGFVAIIFATFAYLFFRTSGMSAVSVRDDATAASEPV